MVEIALSHFGLDLFTDIKNRKVLYGLIASSMEQLDVAVVMKGVVGLRFNLRGLRGHAENYHFMDKGCGIPTIHSITV